MPTDNSQNLLYFEAPTMRDLYQTMQNWQIENEQRLLSLNVQRDGEMFCCIALTNPTEVIIVNGGEAAADVINGSLRVNPHPRYEPPPHLARRQPV